MSKILRKEKESIVVDSNILELYLPEDYPSTSLYRKSDVMVIFYGLGNFRAFNKESDLNKRDETDTIPLCIPSFLTTRPREIDVLEVSLFAKSPKKKCIVLRYYKNDIFIMNENIIKSVDNMSILFDRFLGGKLDHLPYEAIIKLMQSSQIINNLNLRLAPEDLEAIVAEKCRSIKDTNKHARFEKTKPKEITSVNLRVDVGLSSTFNMINFEDINTALVVAHNRKVSGKEEKENIMEKIVKGEKIDPEE